MFVGSSAALHGILNQMNKLQLQIGNFLHFLPFDIFTVQQPQMGRGQNQSQSVGCPVGRLVDWAVYLISCCQLSGGDGSRGEVGRAPFAGLNNV